MVEIVFSESACSFRSARYVHNSPVSINVFNLAGWTSLKYSRCIRPYFPIGRDRGIEVYPTNGMGAALQ